MHWRLLLGRWSGAPPSHRSDLPGRLNDARRYLHDRRGHGNRRRDRCCNGDMHLEELRALLARHARPDWTTAIDGVLISKVDRPDPPAPSMSGTVLAVIAQGAKHLALGDRVYEYGAGQYLVASVD